MYKLIIESMLPMFEFILLQKQSHSWHTLKTQCENNLIILDTQLQSLSPDIREAIHYALVAWVDDHLKNNPWPDQATWHLHSLQRDFYHEQTAGDGFYSRLDRYRMQGARWREAILAYCLCLEFGFLGKRRLLPIPSASALLVECHAYLQIDTSPANFPFEAPVTLSQLAPTSFYPRLYFLISSSLLFVGVILLGWQHHHFNHIATILQKEIV